MHQVPSNVLQKNTAPWRRKWRRLWTTYHPKYYFLQMTLSSIVLEIAIMRLLKICNRVLIS